MSITICKTINGNLLNDAGSSNPGLCDNLEGRYGVGVEGRFNREGTHS